jgi:hypothetical protein
LIRFLPRVARRIVELTDPVVSALKTVHERPCSVTMFVAMCVPLMRVLIDARVGCFRWRR